MRPMALVTGASSGIGAAFARRLARDGYDLMLVARDAARLEALAADLHRRYGCAAVALAADLGNSSDLMMVESRIAQANTLTLLVNNAGFITLERFAETDIERQEAMIRVHIVASMRLTRVALPGMLARRQGAIINVSSTAAFIAGPGNVTYSATKAFLNMFTEGLALELRGSGVQVQALCPGWTRTEIHARQGYNTSGVPAPHWMSAEDVVEASLAALQRGQVWCIPGTRNRRIVLLPRLLPRPLLWLISGRSGNQRTERK